MSTSAERSSPRSYMRRHHFLSLRETEHPPDSISLLIGAEADQRRRRSTQIPPSPAAEMHRRLNSVFGGTVPGRVDDKSSNSINTDKTNDSTDNSDNEEESASFLGRVHSYSRLMHAHTKSQLARPTVGTLPSYKKTMHAFTLNQLNSHRRASYTQSETNSPRMSVSRPGSGVALPSRLHAELSKLVLDEVPPAPGNTPEAGGVGGVAMSRGESHVHGLDFRKLKRRSITDPDMVRSIVAGGVGVRDFASG